MRLLILSFIAQQKALLLITDCDSDEDSDLKSGRLERASGFPLLAPDLNAIL